MKWTEESVASLPTDGGYRLRGEAMTRIEVFSDAVFAFAVTMLVISLSAIPENYAELIAAIKGVPAFAASFAVVMVLWISHRRWSRRFGLDDGVSTFLTLVLVFIVLVYIYPLKLMMSVLFYACSGGWLPANFAIANASEVAGLVALFSVGSCLVASTQLGLYLRVSARADGLCLNALERLLVREEQIIWAVQAVIGVVALLVALIFINSLGYLAGLVHALTPLGIFFSTLGVRKERRALLAEPVEEPAESTTEPATPVAEREQE